MVRISDTLKQQNDLTSFPVAYSDGIWLDKNKGVGTADYSDLQTMYNNDELGSGGSSIQVDTLPIPSEDEVGKVYQYIGENGTYKKGYFYECIHNRFMSTQSAYRWLDVGHYRYNHVVYHQTTVPINSDFVAGDIIYYTGVKTDKFKTNYYYRALPSAGTMKKYTFNMFNENGLSTVYWSYTPFEFRLGFIIYPTGSGGEEKPYEITSITDEKVILTPYGEWGGETLYFDGVLYVSEVKDWEELEGGGGTSIFYGTMDEWNALTTDEKKKYDYMTDDDEGDDKSATGVITRNTSNTSGIQEAYLKRIGKTVLLHCNLTDCVLPANEITTYATVQDGFRPDSSLQWAMLDLDFTIEGLRGWITNSGNIQLLSPVATTNSIRIQSMYFTD